MHRAALTALILTSCATAALGTLATLQSRALRALDARVLALEHPQPAAPAALPPAEETTAGVIRRVGVLEELASTQQTAQRLDHQAITALQSRDGAGLTSRVDELAARVTDLERRSPRPDTSDIPTPTAELTAPDTTGIPDPGR